MVNLKLVDVILRGAGAFQSGARDRAIRARRAHSPSPGARARPGQSTHAIRDHGLGLWRRHGPRRRLGDRDASEQPAHHADRDPRIRISLPHHALRVRAGFGRRRAMARRPEPAARIRVAGRRRRSIRRFDKTRFPPEGLAGGKAGTAARASSSVGTPQEHDTPASAATR